jgi:hypothetical protein
VFHHFLLLSKKGEGAPKGHPRDQKADDQDDEKLIRAEAGEAHARVS